MNSLRMLASLLKNFYKKFCAIKSLREFLKRKLQVILRAIIENLGLFLIDSLTVLHSFLKIKKRRYLIEILFEIFSSSSILRNFFHLFLLYKYN
jgi:hypothetical protein